MGKLFDKVETNTFGIPSKMGVYAVCIRRIGFKERVVYIGSSKNMSKRLMSLSHPYRKLYDRLTDGDVLVYTKSIMTEHYVDLEKKLIQEYKPILNKRFK
jgi:excinuclease UvrABC nuclease subunit